MKIYFLSVFFILTFISGIFASTVVVYECNGTPGGDFAVGPDGKCYHAVASSDLIILTTNMSDTWTTSVIYDQGGSVDPGSICFDPEGNPTILISDSSFVEHMHIARYNGSSWDVEDTGVAGTDAGMVYGLDGKLYVFYINFAFMNTPSQLCWMYKSGSIWQTEVIDTSLSCTTPSPLVDSEGTLHVAYMKDVGSSFALYYAKRTGSSWSPQNVRTLPAYEFYGAPCLVLDNDENPHIAINKFNYLEGVYCVFYNGSTWETDTIIESQWAGYSSFKTDIFNKPYISYGYKDAGNCCLRYKDSSGWSSEGIIEEKINSTDAGAYALMAFDSQNNLWACYRWTTDEKGPKLHYSKINDFSTTQAQFWNIYE